MNHKTEMEHYMTEYFEIHSGPTDKQLFISTQRLKKKLFEIYITAIYLNVPFQKSVRERPKGEKYYRLRTRPSNSLTRRTVCRLNGIC